MSKNLSGSPTIDAMLTALLATIGAFPLYWNVDQSREPKVDVTQFSFRPRNSTQVGNVCASDPPPHSNPGCKHWTQGLFPTIDDDGTALNGGVPQAGNLSAHLANIRETLPLWLPDPDWSGNAVLDFEAWTTVWELNVSPDSSTGPKTGWHAMRYQNYSRLLVEQDHPNWNATRVEAAAKAAFEAAATEWFVRTLEECKQIRPKAKWGFYGLPLGFTRPCSGSGMGMGCGYDGPTGATLRQQAEVKQLPIWKASTALYPSIYISDALRGNASWVRAYIANTIVESVHCAALAADPPLPVYAYGWDHYHAGVLELDAADLKATLEVSAANGASGVVWWGSSSATSNSSYWSWFSAIEGPLVKAWCAAREGGC